MVDGGGLVLICGRDDGVVDRVVVVEGGGGLRVVRRRPLWALPLLVLQHSVLHCPICPLGFPVSSCVMQMLVYTTQVRSGDKVA